MTDKIEIGKSYKMRNGDMTPPLAPGHKPPLFAFTAAVAEGGHTSGTSWDINGKCIAGSTTFTSDIRQFDLVDFVGEVPETTSTQPKDNGGPAFPQVMISGGGAPAANPNSHFPLGHDAGPYGHSFTMAGWGGVQSLPLSSGMSLRDYFAGKALVGLVSFDRSTDELNEPAHFARFAYALADAMLSERTR